MNFPIIIDIIFDWDFIRRLVKYKNKRELIDSMNLYDGFDSCFVRFALNVIWPATEITRYRISAKGPEFHHLIWRIRETTYTFGANRVTIGFFFYSKCSPARSSTTFFHVSESCETYEWQWRNGSADWTARAVVWIIVDDAILVRPVHLCAAVAAT